jgi:hypothetical protein
MYDKANMKKVILAAATAMTLILSLSVVGCNDNNSTATTAAGSPGETTIADSIVTAQIISITAQSTGYPWMVGLLIESTNSVGTLLNPVEYSVGDAVAVLTNQDMSTFNENDTITAKITIATNTNASGGISLFMYSVALQSSP